jgi:hypothetical protein
MADRQNQPNQYTETITTPREPMMKIMPRPQYYTLKAVTGIDWSEWHAASKRAQQYGPWAMPQLDGKLFKTVDVPSSMRDTVALTSLLSRTHWICSNMLLYSDYQVLNLYNITCLWCHKSQSNEHLKSTNTQPKGLKKHYLP